MKIRKVIPIGLVVLVCLVQLARYITGKSPAVFALISPKLVSSPSVAENVMKGSGDIVYDSLGILADRRDPIVVDRAIDLLNSDDDYMWLNAAQYLGACGRQEAVPYLIKALRHTAWRSDAKRVQLLRELTNEDFGTDFSRWQSWWVMRHPDNGMDWASNLGHAPRIGTSVSKPKDSQDP